MNLRIGGLRKPVKKLAEGEVGYVCANIKSAPGIASAEVPPVAASNTQEVCLCLFNVYFDFIVGVSSNA